MIGCEDVQELESKEAVLQQKPALSLAATAIAAARAATSSTAANSHGKVKVTETRRFAGKDIEVCFWPHRGYDRYQGDCHEYPLH